MTDIDCIDTKCRYKHNFHVMRTTCPSHYTGTLMCLNDFIGSKLLLINESYNVTCFYFVYDFHVYLYFYMNSCSSSQFALESTDTSNSNTSSDFQSTSPSSVYDQCNSANVLDSNYTRSITYEKEHTDSDECESPTLAEGWYRYDGFYRFATQSARVGLCGTYTPIYIQGNVVSY